jgi:hypothetical protein
MAQFNQVLRGACRLRMTAKGGFSLPRLAHRQAHSSFFLFLISSDFHRIPALKNRVAAS